MEPDKGVRWRYEVTDEDARLWRPGIGDLVRLRTWEILERVIPSPGRVLDVGGSPALARMRRTWRRLATPCI